MKLLISRVLSVLCLCMVTSPFNPTMADAKTLSCPALHAQIRNLDGQGQIAFNEWMLQVSRIGKSNYSKTELWDSAENLTNNYISVHQLLINNAQCLVDRTLLETIKGGLKNYQKNLSLLKTGDAHNLQIAMQAAGQYNMFDRFIK